MVLTLEVTGDVIPDGAVLSSFSLDHNNCLGMENDALKKIIGQVVQAINALGHHLEKTKEDSEQLHDAVEHLEQQISAFEVRSRECEDTCQEVRLQLGTMAMAAEKQPEKEEVIQVKSEVSRKDLNELVHKIEDIMRECEVTRKGTQNAIDDQLRKIMELEESLGEQQHFLDDELEPRLTQNDDQRIAIRADVEAIRQTLKETNDRKASKVDLSDVAHRALMLEEAQEKIKTSLEDATEQFDHLSGLTDLVSENKKKMQYQWDLLGKESQNLREWASTGFAELRGTVRTKMGEREALSHISELRKEMQSLSPFISESMTRIEASVRNKAAASDVNKLQEDVEVISRTTAKPNQLLMGTKCLVCDHQVHSANATDKGPLSLANRYQEKELWNEVQRVLEKKRPDSEPSGKNVLKYVAIHVGSPMKAADVSGHGAFDCRDTRDQSPGGHYLMRVGGGGGGLSRPQSQGGPERPGREVPPLLRVAARRPGPPGRYSGSPSTPATPRQLRENRPGAHSTVKAALGPLSTSQSPPKLSSPADWESAEEQQFPSVKMQPAAHSGMHQPQAMDYGDAYVIEREYGDPSLDDFQPM